ncbi:MAG: 30S ribosomal protein S2 [Candidatus Pacebacteria bacterium]|nr:30S ribosomal protein S2 [Candidatus Paceibacterota bacterium]MBP9851892.1 30S ribosomal protein S2 [Candidatus Paceibacterota bacterium]
MDNTTIEPVIEKLFSAGAHYGYSRTRRHPSVKNYILTTKNGTDIINVEHTQEQLIAAKEFVASVAAKGGVILFVGTKPEARATVERVASTLGMPFIVERWVGGILTNWSEIKKRTAKLEELRGKKERGELDMYTKKERLMIDIDIAKMTKLFSGLVGMTKLPDALVLVDAKEEDIAVKEARVARIPVVAITNTDNNIKGLDYPIMGNDASRSSITYLIEEIEAGIKSATITTQ